METDQQAPEQDVEASVPANGYSLDNEIRWQGPEEEAEVEYSSALESKNF